MGMSGQLQASATLSPVNIKSGRFGEDKHLSCPESNNGSIVDLTQNLFKKITFGVLTICYIKLSTVTCFGRIGNFQVINKTCDILGRLVETVSFIKRSKISFLHER